MDTMLLEYARLQRSVQPYAIVDPSPKNDFAGVATYRTINAAIGAGHTWIRLAAGTHAPFSCAVADVTIEGPKTAIIDGGTTAHAAYITAANFTIRGVTLRTTGGAGNDYDAIHCAASYLTVEQVWIDDADRIGIYVTNGSLHKILDSYISGTDSAGIAIDGTAGGQVYSPTVSRCYVGSSALGNGIYFDKVSNGSIHSCQSVAHAGSGIVIGYSGTTQAISIQDNWLASNGAYGLQIYQTGSAGNHNIGNNIYNGNATAAKDQRTNSSTDADEESF